MQNFLTGISCFCMPKKHVWGIVILAMIVLFGAYITYLLRDIPPFDDSDMSVSSSILKDEENAYFDLLEMEKTIYFPEDKKEFIAKMVNGEEWDQVFADELISKNRDALNSYRNILNRKGYQDPGLQEDPSSFSIAQPLKSISLFRSASYINVIRAYSFAKKGDFSVAKSILLENAKIGHSIQNSSRETLVSYLVGLAMKKASLTSLQNIVYGKEIPEKGNFSEIQNLERLRKNSFGSSEVFRVEYQVIKNVLKESNWKDMEDLTERNIHPLYFYVFLNRNETLHYVYDRYKGYALLGGDDQCMNQNEIPARYAWEKEGIKKRNGDEIQFPSFETTLEKNAIGKYLYLVTTASLLSVHERRCEDSFLVLQTQLALAVNAYKADNGTYPKELNALVPKYMKSVSEEFAGRPIEYDSETGRIANMKDFYRNEE